MNKYQKYKLLLEIKKLRVEIEISEKELELLDKQLEKINQEIIWGSKLTLIVLIISSVISLLT